MCKRNKTCFEYFATNKQVKPAVKVHAVVCTLQRRKVNRMEGRYIIVLYKAILKNHYICRFIH